MSVEESEDNGSDTKTFFNSLASTGDKPAFTKSSTPNSISFFQLQNCKQISMVIQNFNVVSCGGEITF